jgi:hypothetical protein
MDGCSTDDNNVLLGESVASRFPRKQRRQAQESKKKTRNPTTLGFGERENGRFVVHDENSEWH